MLLWAGGRWWLYFAGVSQRVGWFYKLNPNAVKGATIVIMLAAVCLSLSARREDSRIEQAGTVHHPAPVNRVCGCAF
jgi:hypothetical protein